MNKLLNILSEKFDFLICDSPPVLTVTDGLVLSKVLDGTVVVSRAGKTPYEIVRRGLKSFENIKSHVLGVVINAFDIKKSAYYYYRSYNYYYSDEEPKSGQKSGQKR